MSVTFERLLAERLSRRRFVGLAGAAAGVAAGVDGGLATTAAATRPAGTRAARQAAARLAPSTLDRLLLASGYRYDVVARWGDALWKSTASLNGADLQRGVLVEAGAAALQERRFGTNCDAIAYFGERGSSRRGVLCVNHEYVQVELAFSGLSKSGRERASDRQRWTEAHPHAVRWMQAAHGVSVVHVERGARGWQLRPGGPLTRRITATTPCEITGPARGADLLRTVADPTGTRALGTIANCAGGRTPWGTYLTAEENVDDYFGYYRSWAAQTDDILALAAHARFPGLEQSLYGWEHTDPRFDLRREPREPLRFGWIVEIDPRNPSAPPKKRTALGRFSHEGANTILAKDGRVAAYTADDDKFEYVYKFVTRERFDPQRPQANRDLLDSGTLYVARFDASGSGRWLPLVYDEGGPLCRRNGFRNQADVVVKAREAADLLGATPMDRPEDVEPNPLDGRVYIAMTKNGDREPERRVDFYTNREIDLGVDAANPRPRNDFGHVLELVEAGSDAAATEFAWNVFLLAGNPSAPDARLLTRPEDIAPGSLARGDTYYAGYPAAADLSPIACADNLGFDPSGRLWLVTDSDEALGANDGCYVVPTDGPLRGQLRQIASAPAGAEVCGCEFTPDGRTLFLSIQHPGEGGTIDEPASHWPDGGSLPPRSALVAVTREDDAPI